MKAFLMAFCTAITLDRCSDTTAISLQLIQNVISRKGTYFTGYISSNSIPMQNELTKLLEGAQLSGDSSFELVIRKNKLFQIG